MPQGGQQDLSNANAVTDDIEAVTPAHAGGASVRHAEASAYRGTSVYRSLLHSGMAMGLLVQMCPS